MSNVDKACRRAIHTLQKAEGLKAVVVMTNDGSATQGFLAGRGDHLARCVLALLEELIGVSPAAGALVLAAGAGLLAGRDDSPEWAAAGGKARDLMDKLKGDSK